MEGLVRGDVVITPFPFTDLSSTKRRPSLVLANLPGQDVILCQITSKARSDILSISLHRTDDFETGSLLHNSNIRPNRLFTGHKAKIVKTVGRIKSDKLDEVINAVTNLLKM